MTIRSLGQHLRSAIGLVLLNCLLAHADAASLDACVSSADGKAVDVRFGPVDAKQSGCDLKCTVKQTDPTHTVTTCVIGVESSTKPACMNLDFDKFISQAAALRKFSCNEKEQ